MTSVDDREKDVYRQYFERYLTRQHTESDCAMILNKGYELLLLGTNTRGQMATQVIDIGQAIYNILHEGPGISRAEDLVLGHLMILDDRIITHLAGTEIDIIAKSQAQKHFVAFYVWTILRDTKTGSRRSRALADVKVIWNWDALMGFEREMTEIFGASLGRGFGTACPLANGS